MSKVFNNVEKEKPIGILQNNSSSLSYINNNNTSSLLIKSFNTSKKHLTFSPYHHKKNFSSPPNLSQEVKFKRNKTYRQGTLNTFISTSETDKQDTIENYHSYFEKNRGGIFKKQLSKITENPNNKNINDCFNINDVNMNNLSHSMILIQHFGNEKKGNLFKKRYSFYINKEFLNKSIRVNSAINRKKRKKSKQIIDLKHLFNYDKIDLNDNCLSDNQNNEKNIILSDICVNLIEQNQLREIQYQTQKNKLLSFFSIDNENEPVNKAKKNKNQIIDSCINKIKKFVKILSSEKKNTKINLKDIKNKILINEKERRILKNVTNYFFKKLLIAQLCKEWTNIVHLKYAYSLSENYFKITLNPKNLSFKLENNSKINIFESFKLEKKNLRRGSFPVFSFKFKNLIINPLIKKKSTCHSKIYRLSSKSIKYINNFVLKDCHKDEQLKVYKLFVNRIQMLIPEKKRRYKNYYWKKSAIAINIKDKDKIKKQGNKDSIDKYDKPFLPKEFFDRIKKIKIKRKKARLSTIIPISAKSLTTDMKKMNIYLKNESLINNKEHTMLRTIEIKSQIESKLNNEIEKLIYCIKDLNFPQFKIIFEKHTLSPNLQDKNGNTLLSLAVQSNSFQISNYLLNSGADPNISNVRIIKLNFNYLFFREKEIIHFIML